MRIVLLAGLLAVGTGARADELPGAAAGRALIERALLLRAVREVPPERPFLARVEDASASFLGARYVLGPLGEGTGPEGVFDSDPLVDLTAVDCTTFVEQSLAAARAGGTGSAMMDELRRVRYEGGVVSYATRNHFAEVDWLPNNAAAGVIRDVTRDAGGDSVRVATKVIRKREWYAAKTAADLSGPLAAGLSDAEKEELVARWRRLGEGMPDEQARVPYVPLEDLAEALPRVPSGAVVSVVRADDPAIPVLISHQGFLIRRPDGAVLFRHARTGQRVMDQDFLGYFEGQGAWRWPVVGLNFSLPLAP